VEENSTWIVCKQVMDGTAEKVQVCRDNVCLCLDCAEDVALMETEQIQALEKHID
jgi:predicted protein tyrosine phosphatase